MTEDRAAPRSATAQAGPTLAVRDLSVALRRGLVRVPLISDVSFGVHRGETLGLVGESGCGKTVTSLAIMDLLSNDLVVTSGSVRFEGQELIGMQRRKLDTVRGRSISMIFQDARRSLNPTMTVGHQIAEVARKHLGIPRQQAGERAVELLGLVGIRHPRRRAGDYPYAFSGGMLQRVMLAIALVCDPQLLIADEPTTALDVTVQAQVLRLIRRLQDDLGLGVLLITHDLGVVAEMCDRVAVMYAGQVVEEAGVDTVFRRPAHPYTAALLSAVPRPENREAPLVSIPGLVPSAEESPGGCRFAPRCDHAGARCKEESPTLRPVDGAHSVRCVRYEELELRGVDSAAHS